MRVRSFAFIGAVAIVGAVATPSGAYERPGQTERVSVSSSGGQAHTNLRLLAPYNCSRITFEQQMDMSADGRYVVFTSGADNLVSGDTDNSCDVFVHDTRTGKTTRVSVSSDGQQAFGSGVAPWDPTKLDIWPDSGNPSISANGRYVVFASFAPNLVPGDTNLDEDVFLHDMKSGKTTRISVDSNGAQTVLSRCGDLGTLPAAASWEPTISSDGRFVVFTGCASNLVGGDTNNDADVFVRALKTHRTYRVSLDQHGRQLAGPSFSPSISGDGQRIAFATPVPATDSDKSQAVGHWDVFLRDVRKKTTSLVSATLSGNGNWDSDTGNSDGARPGGRQLSDSGRYVAFESASADLVPNDSHGDAVESLTDIFVRDTATGRTQRVSVNSFGEEGYGTLSSCTGYAGDSISATGRYVEFQSSCPQFYPYRVNTDSNATSPNVDVFLYDRSTGQLDVLSTTRSGKETSSTCWSLGGPVSANGRYVGFESCAADLVRHDTNNDWDYFVRDRGLDLGAGGWGGQQGSGGGGGGSGQICLEGVCIPPMSAVSAPDRSADVGRVLGRQGANLTGTSIAYRPGTRDLFVREELQSMPSVAGAPVVGNPGILYGFDLTADGARYEVRAQRVPGPSYDAAGGASFGLFRLGADGTWTQVATLRGGYGTTGDEVVFALPLKAIGVGTGGRLGHLSAFTALGTFATGAASVLDRVRLR